jgi:hypothetical protein
MLSFLLKRFKHFFSYNTGFLIFIGKGWGDFPLSIFFILSQYPFYPFNWGLFFFCLLWGITYLDRPQRCVVEVILL